MYHSHHTETKPNLNEERIEDIIIAMRYVIDSMHKHGLSSVAQTFEDISLYIENFTTIAQGTALTNEQQSLIASYMVTKYATKITLDKHKKSTLLAIKNILAQNDNNTV